MTSPSLQQRSLEQQGYDDSAAELGELHFALAGIGILPFWLPAWHPFDLLYNHLLRPLWNGVELPPNPLPRRIACVMGGTMNLGIGFAFLYGNVPLAYVFGIILVALQVIVISTHFCVASWMFEGLVRLSGRWTRPIPVERAKELVRQGAQLVDVREPDEFARGHLPGAVNLPLGQIDQHAGALGSKPTILYCQSGMRSQRALQLLKKRRLDQVYNLGALTRWS